MRKIVKSMMLSMVLSVVLLGGSALAGTTGYVEENYGEYKLNCYISCTSSKGIAKTKGSMTDHKCRATITIYDQNGVGLGNNATIAKVGGEAVASVSKEGKVYSALSCHSLVRNLDDTHVYPLYKQVQKSEDRY